MRIEAILFQCSTVEDRREKEKGIPTCACLQEIEVMYTRWQSVKGEDVDKEDTQETKREESLFSLFFIFYLLIFIH